MQLLYGVDNNSSVSHNPYSYTRIRDSWLRRGNTQATEAAQIPGAHARTIANSGIALPDQLCTGKHFLSCELYFVKCFTKPDSHTPRISDCTMFRVSSRLVRNCVYSRSLPELISTGMEILALLPLLPTTRCQRIFNHQRSLNCHNLIRLVLGVIQVAERCYSSRARNTPRDKISHILRLNLIFLK